MASAQATRCWLAAGKAGGVLCTAFVNRSPVEFAASSSVDRFTTNPWGSPTTPDRTLSRGGFQPREPMQFSIPNEKERTLRLRDRLTTTRLPSRSRTFPRPQTHSRPCSWPPTSSKEGAGLSLSGSSLCEVAPQNPISAGNFRTSQKGLIPRAVGTRSRDRRAD